MNFIVHVHSNELLSQKPLERMSSKLGLIESLFSLQEMDFIWCNITKRFDCSLFQFVRFLVSKIYSFILNHPQIFPYMEPLIEVPFLTLTTHKHRSKNQILISPVLWSMSKGTHWPLKNVSFWIYVTQYSILSIVFVLKLHDFYNE
jgi:hypothetical protein